MTARDNQNAVAYWRQFPVTAHFDEPQEIVGTVKDLLEIGTGDKARPKLHIQLDDGTIVIVVAGQVRLQAELVKACPAVGDRIKIVYHGEAKRAMAGMNPAKEFTVKVRRPGQAQPDGDGVIPDENQGVLDAG